MSPIPTDLHFAKSIFTDSHGQDMIDLDRSLDDMIVMDPYEAHAPSRRSDKEVASMLALLDNLEQGKETTR
jgi:hypothetical protein